MASMDQESARGSPCARFKAVVEKFRSKIVDAFSEGKKLGVEDPRRIIHSLKVGLAITLVSLFYYFDPLYQGFGVNAMWAVITTVVVFEFSVGATLGRGVNRAIATFLAASLGVGAHHLANLPGDKIEPVFLGLFVFLVAAAVSFIRFYPKLKARYDYGLLIFIMTFCLISVSGYRNDQVLKMAYKRVYTIVIGGTAAVAVCSFICPVWAGEDLHNLIAGNIENLGIFLQGFVHEYFRTSDDDLVDETSSDDEYKSVLNSKGTEEFLANFAKWEPRHGGFRYRHPWDQYLKIGVLVRECAYRIDALNGYLNLETKTPAQVRAKLGESFSKMTLESSLALKELASSMKAMSCSSMAGPHIVNTKGAAEKLKLLLKKDLWEDANYVEEIIPTAAVSSLLIEIVSCIEKIGDSVGELASMAKFKNDVLKQKETGKGKVLRVPSIQRSHIITITAE